MSPPPTPTRVRRPAKASPTFEAAGRESKPLQRAKQRDETLTFGSKLSGGYG